MSIVPHSFYFRQSIAIPEIKSIPRKQGQPLKLPASASIPDFTFQPKSQHWGDVRVGWNQSGLGISLDVKKKQHPASPTDYLQIWIDTRDTKTIHRANRYCHLFQFQAVADSSKQPQPACSQLTIHRAQSDAPQADLADIKLWSKLSSKGYQLEAWIPAHCLAGFDPASYPQMGFYYQISDSELGEQFMIVDQEFPVGQDPSLWATLRFEA